MLTLLLADLAERVAVRVDQRKLSALGLALVISAVTLLTGAKGLFLLVVSSAAGTLPLKLEVRRLNCMGCLLFPLILLYSGFHVNM